LANERVERRLTAVLAADVAGYSRLMGVDEEGTLAQLKACRRELIDPKISEHRGRIVKTTGDGMLVEFASVVDALRCAVEVQRGMVARNSDVRPDRRIEFRIGINVGDIMIDGGDIFGDGVNIAARLEAMAEPGGIFISGRAQEDVEGKLDIGFEDAGEQQLKNIAKPVRVYRVCPDGEAPKMRPAPWSSQVSTRRLAVIMVADLAGFSAMMERDDDGTLARIKAMRREVFEPQIGKHKGRTVKMMGDGFIAEFASATEALRCGIAIQGLMAGRVGAEGGEPIKLRVGINLGEIIVEENGDIFGVGVNVAARLEALAEPGGICISRKVRDEVRDKLDLALEDMGEQQVKNISRPVRVFSIAAPVTGQATASAKPALTLPDKPSIAVLPFQNMSGDPEQEYFADGMVEEIITALSRVRSFSSSPATRASPTRASRST
jgi:class 3 adenylate cyclase